MTLPFFGETRVSGIAVGPGTRVVEIDVVNKPPADDDYRVSAFIGPVEGEFEDAFATAEPFTVSVLANDHVDIVDAPTEINPIGTVTVEIDYAAQEHISSEARDIVVSLLGPGTNFLFFGEDRITNVEVGSGTVVAEIDVENLPPVGDYRLSAFIGPEGKGSDEAFAVSTPITVSVRANDDVDIVDAPTEINPIGTVSVEIDYAAQEHISSEARDIVVSLLGPAPAFLFFGEDRISNVEVGSGTVVAEIDVENLPPAGTNYQFSAFIGPVGQNFEQAFATAEPVTVSIRTNDQIEIVAAPMEVNPIGTFMVELAYQAQTHISEDPRDIVVTLLASTNFAFHGEARLTEIATGSGTVVAELNVENLPPVGDDYRLSAFIGGTGGDFADAFATAEPVTISVRSNDHIEIEDATREISPIGTVTVELAFDAKEHISSGPRDLLVTLLRPSDNFAFFGETRLTGIEVGPGTRVTEIEVVNRPPAGDDYRLTAFLGPQGGTAEQAFSTSEPFTVTVLPGDELSFTTAPSVITPSGSQLIELRYAARENISTSDRDIVISLLSDGDFTLFGFKRIPAIQAGSDGVVSTVVNVVNDPPEGTNYLWTAFMGPAGGNFPNSFVQANPVSVEITTVGEESAAFTMAASSDDAEEASNGTVSLTSTDLELVEEAGQAQLVGIRFDEIDLPKNATLLNAYVQFVVDEVSRGSAVLSIQAEAADDALTFSTATNDLSSRPRTSASVSWNPQAWTEVGERGPVQRTADISLLLQEVMSRPGWVSGNAVSLLISGSGRRTAEAFDTAAEVAPVLHVDYTVVNTPPSVDAGEDQTVNLSESALLNGVVTDDGLPDPPAAVTLEWSKQTGPGEVTFSDPSLAATSASFSEAGVYVLVLTANDGSENGDSDSVTITVEDNVGVEPLFTAYNDLSWAEGQLSENITLYTSDEGSGEPPQGSSGLLVDYETGQDTAVTLSVTGGTWIGPVHAAQGSLSESGTDAHDVFDGIVDATGILNRGATDIVLHLAGLDPSLRYEVVVFGNRDNPSYTGPDQPNEPVGSGLLCQREYAWGQFWWCIG